MCLDFGDKKDFIHVSRNNDVKIVDLYTSWIK